MKQRRIRATSECSLTNIRAPSLKLRKQTRQNIISGERYPPLAHTHHSSDSASRALRGPRLFPSRASPIKWGGREKPVLRYALAVLEMSHFHRGHERRHVYRPAYYRPTKKKKRQNKAIKRSARATLSALASRKTTAAARRTKAAAAYTSHAEKAAAARGSHGGKLLRFLFAWPQ